jgi:hypothetical protein
MNRIERLFGTRGEARLRYGDGEYKIIANGDFVRCAVTGTPIPLAELRYWSVARQEAYVSAAQSLQRHLEFRAQGAAGKDQSGG